MAASRQEPKLTRACSVCLPRPYPAQTSRYCSRMTQTCRPSAALVPHRSRGDSMDALQHRVVACVGVRCVWQRVTQLVSKLSLDIVPRGAVTRAHPHSPARILLARALPTCRQPSPRRRPGPSDLLREVAVAAHRACPGELEFGHDHAPGLSELPGFPDRQAEPGQWFVVPSVAVVSCRRTMVASFSPGRRLPWQTFRRC